MSLLYVDEHLSCIHYQKKEPLIKIFSYKKGEDFELLTPNESKFLFLREGELSVSYNGFIEEKISRKQVILMPINNTAKFNVIEDAHFMTIAFDVHINMCESFSLTQLYPYCKNKNSSFCALDFNQQMNDYINLLEQYISDGINCIHLYHLKKTELFYIFRAYYSKEVLADFFQSILIKEDLFFKKFVMANCLSAKNVQELASMANYSTSGFIKKFERCFNDSPYHWITQYKAKHILREINNGEKSFKDICADYNFSSMPHFIEFCKKQYGNTPGKMRKEQLKGA